MIRRVTPQGNPYDEPPYSAEEESEFYRRVGKGPVSVTRPTGPSSATPAHQEQRPEEPRPRDGRGEDR